MGLFFFNVVPSPWLCWKAVPRGLPYGGNFLFGYASKSVQETARAQIGEEFLLKCNLKHSRIFCEKLLCTSGDFYIFSVKAVVAVNDSINALYYY